MFPETRIQGPRLRCKSLQGMTMDDQIFDCVLFFIYTMHVLFDYFTVEYSQEFKNFCFLSWNNTFISLLFKKKHVNKLILFNGLITVLDFFFLQLNKTHN